MSSVADPVDRAETLYVRARVDATATEAEASALAREAEACGDPATEALARRALAMAVRETDARRARTEADRALSVAETAGLDEIADRMRVTLAGIDAMGGDLDKAWDALASVVARGHGRATAEARAQLAFVALYRGDLDDARALAGAALAELPRDDVWYANALTNRGLAAGYAGDVAQGEADLLGALAILEALACTSDAAEIRHNLGWLLDLKGDYAGALGAFAETEAALGMRPEIVGWLARDRASTLLAVGLASAAADEAGRSARAFARIGRTSEQADSLRIRAAALELAGDHAPAADVGAQAASALHSTGRHLVAHQAELVVLRARTHVTVTVDDVDAARQLADALAAATAPTTACEARLMAAALARRTGDLDGAAADLAAAGAARDAPRAELRIAYWTVMAELRRARDQRAPALSAVRQGLRSLDEAQATLGATEARVNIAAAASGLGQIAVELARDGERPARLFDWAERARASAQRYRPARPPDDDQLARDRAELRLVTQAIVEAENAAADLALRRVTDRPAGTPDDPDVLRARQVKLERAVRYRLLAAAGRSRGAQRATAASVRRALGEATMLSYLSAGDRLLAVRVDADGIERFDLGSLDEVRYELGHLRAGLVRMARGRPSRLTLDVVAAGLRRLDATLLGPIDATGGPLVIVPTGDLAAVPWATLPRLEGVALSIAPSATAWARASANPSGARRGQVVLAAGPALAHAESEIAELASVHPRATTFGVAESVGSVLLAAIDGAALFHLACHGTFRDDNPLFSNLQVADGPLAVHDLEVLEQPPETVVLSACDSGRDQPRRGDEWFGLASALLALGTRSVIASVIPVPDAPVVVDMMVHLHRRLGEGWLPSRALADLPHPAIGDDPVGFAARSAFVTFGR